jgi:hypothetical protein
MMIPIPIKPYHRTLTSPNKIPARMKPKAKLAVGVRWFRALFLLTKNTSTATIRRMMTDISIKVVFTAPPFFILIAK